MTLTAQEKKNIRVLIAKLYSLESAADFRTPVIRAYPEIATEYLSIVPCPMDLSTLLVSLEDESVGLSLCSVKDNLRLIFSNAIKFNEGSTLMEAVCQHLEEYTCCLWEEFMGVRFYDNEPDSDISFNQHLTEQRVRKLGGCDDVALLYGEVQHVLQYCEQLSNHDVMAHQIVADCHQRLITTLTAALADGDVNGVRPAAASQVSIRNIFLPLCSLVRSLHASVTTSVFASLRFYNCGNELFHKSTDGTDAVDVETLPHSSMLQLQEYIKLLEDVCFGWCVEEADPCSKRPLSVCVLCDIWERITRGCPFSSIWATPIGFMWVHTVGGTGSNKVWWPAMLIGGVCSVTCDDNNILTPLYNATSTGGTSLHDAHVTTINTIKRLPTNLKKQLQKAKPKAQTPSVPTDSLVDECCFLVEFFGSHDFGWIKAAELLEMGKAESNGGGNNITNLWYAMPLGGHRNLWQAGAGKLPATQPTHILPSAIHLSASTILRSCGGGPVKECVKACNWWCAQTCIDESRDRCKNTCADRDAAAGDDEEVLLISPAHSSSIGNGSQDKPVDTVDSTTIMTETECQRQWRIMQQQSTPQEVAPAEEELEGPTLLPPQYVSTPSTRQELYANNSITLGELQKSIVNGCHQPAPLISPHITGDGTTVSAKYRLHFRDAATVHSRQLSKWMQQHRYITYASSSAPKSRHNSLQQSPIGFGSSDAGCVEDGGDRKRKVRLLSSDGDGQSPGDAPIDSCADNPPVPSSGNGASSSSGRKRGYHSGDTTKVYLHPSLDDQTKHVILCNSFTKTLMPLSCSAPFNPRNVQPQTGEGQSLVHARSVCLTADIFNYEDHNQDNRLSYMHRERERLFLAVTQLRRSADDRNKKAEGAKENQVHTTSPPLNPKTNKDKPRRVNGSNSGSSITTGKHAKVGMLAQKLHK